MARQKGLLKLKGLLGNLAFYKTKYGYLLRKKSSVDGNRIANDPAFRRTRENSVEFGTGSKAAKLVRMAFHKNLKNIKDGGMVNRFNSVMMKVVKSDLISERGKRNAAMGDLRLLKGFDFNINSSLTATVQVPFTTIINRISGNLQVKIGQFNPGKDVSAPQGATHCRLNSSGAEINFSDGTYIDDGDKTTYIALGAQTEPSVTLSTTVTAASALPLMLVFGIEFYQEINGEMYVLNDGVGNCLKIVEVEI